MTIDSSRYKGLCSCGNEHKVETEFAIIEKDCLKNLDAYLQMYGLGGVTAAIYDKNTYEATYDRHPRVNYEIILDPENLHANELGVSCLMEKLPKNTDVLIAIGSGTIHDITRYSAYTRNAKFVSCPTAASVDGFCSSVAAMTWHGCKKTLTAVAPKIVVADTDIIKNAPMRLTRAGFGDMLGKYIALADWKIANILTGEFYCEKIANVTLNATESVLNSVDGIITGKSEAYEGLMYGLLLSGLAMQMMGNSRPASGAEHHISHFIEMSPPAFSFTSDALHGEKVGVGTLLALKEYKRLKNLEYPIFSSYAPQSYTKLISVFGEYMSKEIFAENKNDVAMCVTKTRLCECWNNICAVIEDLPDPKHLTESYTSLNIKKSLEEIGVTSTLEKEILEHSPFVRNRLTLMRIKKCFSKRSDNNEIR